MMDKLNKPEPKKIKMPPLVDRSNQYDTLSFDGETLYNVAEQTNRNTDEDNRKNNSQSVPELESM